MGWCLSGLIGSSGLIAILSELRGDECVCGGFDALGGLGAGVRRLYNERYVCNCFSSDNDHTHGFYRSCVFIYDAHKQH
jgi:hypothetical protein